MSSPIPNRPPMDQTAQRLREIAIELHRLEEQLYDEAMSSEPLDAQRVERLRQVLQLDEMVYLKGTVDHLRLILRACIEALSPERVPEGESQQARVLRVTRILRILREQMLIDRAQPKNDTFFERIGTLLDHSELSVPAPIPFKKKGKSVA
jgi:hypothetical protein